MHVVHFPPFLLMHVVNWYLSLKQKQRQINKVPCILHLDDEWKHWIICIKHICQIRRRVNWSLQPLIRPCFKSVTESVARAQIDYFIMWWTDFDDSHITSISVTGEEEWYIIAYRIGVCSGNLQARPISRLASCISVFSLPVVAPELPLMIRRSACLFLKPFSITPGDSIIFFSNSRIDQTQGGGGGGSCYVYDKCYIDCCLFGQCEFVFFFL